uniref:Uncharacterized protein n=2 Tax=Sphaerodactylus townsendi TaxID=933632 RepID=A0ACB8G3B0_9SAUR
MTISESYADATYVKQSETASNSFSTATYDISGTTMAFTSDIQTNNVTTTSNYTTSADTTSAKAVLTTNVQTTSRNSSILHSSAEVHESTKENPSNGGVIFGAIVGAVLGCALIGLVGYFMCAKRKFQGFVHQRLYDDMTNDPVLRLDNVPESYGASTADLSYYNPTMANETTPQNSNTPYDAISMDDMTSSPHLP